MGDDGDVERIGIDGLDSEDNADGDSTKHDPKDHGNCSFCLIVLKGCFDFWSLEPLEQFV